MRDMKEEIAAPARIGAAKSPIILRTITEQEAGQRIDNFLMRHFKSVPRSRVYRLLRKGEVRVNKKRVDAEYRMAAGDEVRLPPVRIDSSEEPGRPSSSLQELIEKAVIFQDKHLLVINKPPGVAVHGGSGMSFGVIEALRASRPRETLELVHRLDRDTSGCLCVARDRATLVALHALEWETTHEFLLDGDPANADVKTHVRELASWYRWSTAEREFPITDAAVDYLEREVARVDAGAPVLLWGDPRVGNMIFAEDHTVAAALDFETAMIGPAARDVAHWLVFDQFQTDAVGIDRLPGWPDRATTISRYESLSERPLGNLEFFDVMESLFMATTLIRQADARVAKGLAPPETRMGHDNTVTQMLARALGLPVPALSPDYLAHRGVPTNPRTP